jgi:hypothetical protein
LQLWWRFALAINFGGSDELLGRLTCEKQLADYCSLLGQFSSKRLKLFDNP